MSSFVRGGRGRDTSKQDAEIGLGGRKRGNRQESVKRNKYLRPVVEEKVERGRGKEGGGREKR